MLKRLPKFADILPVFAVISVMYYAWTLVIFIYKLPGWLFYLNLGEIGGILAHEFMTNFLESLGLLLLLLIACILLPPRFFRDAFAVRGTAFSIVLIASMMVFLNRYAATPRIGSSLGIWMLVTLVLAAAVAVVSTRVRFVSKAMAWISDRLIVFLFLLVPLSIISILYLLVRSILV